MGIPYKLQITLNLIKRHQMTFVNFSRLGCSYDYTVLQREEMTSLLTLSNFISHCPVDFCIIVFFTSS